MRTRTGKENMTESVTGIVQENRSGNESESGSESGSENGNGNGNEAATS
jgi:hypothetical protein